MSAGTPCYWLDHTGQEEIGLRRYGKRGHAPGTPFECATGWHEARVWLGERRPGLWVDDGLGGHWAAQEPVPDDDPRWPTECAQGCGYVFAHDDPRQTWAEPVYRRADTGAEEVLHPSGGPDGMRAAGPGAMWHAPWRRDVNPAKPDDGIVLMVRCPGREHAPNDWCPDAASSRSGGYWTRTGDPRRPETLSVTPSIAIGTPGDPGYYHGFLTGGCLTPSLPS